jgi:hypothetical protein
VGLMGVIETKAQPYYEMIKQTKTSRSDFLRIIVSKDINFLVAELDRLTQEIKSSKLELGFAETMDLKILNSKSFIETIIENLDDKLRNNEDLFASKHKTIYDFYVFIIYQITEVHELRLRAHNLRHSLKRNWKL